MSGRFLLGWLVAWMLVCTNAHPAKQATRDYGLSLDFRDYTDNDYGFGDFEADKYTSKSDDGSVEEFRDNGISSTTLRSTYAGPRVTPEPDAEMLPAHYTGVQPPGVDHMEIKYPDSSSSGSDPQSSVIEGSTNPTGKADSARQTLNRLSQSAAGEVGLRRKGAYERARKKESVNETQKDDYGASAGINKSHRAAERHRNDSKLETSGVKGLDYEVSRKRDKGHDAAGYHNVYHKDEYKKDVDYYDNDHETERLRKHGHYNEKHTASEIDLRNTDEIGAEFINAEAAKAGKFEKSGKREESKGHAADSGYQGFFGNFDKFEKQEAPNPRSTKRR